MRHLKSVITLVLALSTAATGASNSTLAQQCEATLRSSLNPDLSLAVTADGVLDGADFSFKRTIGAIIKSAGKDDTAPEREALVDTMLLTFHKQRATNPISGLRMRFDRRPGEATLKAADLLNPQSATGLVPIGLFNRLDLAPGNWDYCGEHRIVYGFKALNGQIPASRLLLIFEAIVPNPRPELGELGCRPVADVWSALSSTGLSDAQRAARLAAFFYEGDLDGDGRKDTDPVVHHRNYGGDARGQVRGNLFVQQPWQLREWRITLEPASLAPVFVSETVKNTPLVEFYADPEPDDAATPSRFIDKALGNEEAAQYQVELVVRYLSNLVVTPSELTQPAAGGSLTPEQLTFSKIALGSDPRFDEFQSTSQGTSDMPRTHAGTRVGVLIDGLLPQAQSAVPEAQKINRVQALNRAYVATCAGCHQPTENGLPGQTTLNVGPGLDFPNSHIARGFAHNSEDRKLSPALRDAFLPVRKENMIAHLCRTAPATVAFRRPVPTMLTASRIAIKAKEEQLLTEPVLQRRIDLTSEIDRSVRALRADDRAQPGAFVRVRRPH